jgi:alkanesulfonate monooxygenase SsuD/methylene tetrahydromethanopterin reductase-like flavin-dependent oxidoreductase (luciferase family)
MRVGIGLPTTAPDVTGQLLLEWARRAEAGPFSSLGVLDRTAYDSYDPFLSLASVAAVTWRVRLVTMIAIGPLRNTALLAKESASLHLLSRGRLTLGLAVGARREDYAVAGVDYRTRGRRLGEQLSTLPDLWEEGRLAPHDEATGFPDILVGGLSEQTFARVARYAQGYAHGGGPPRAFARMADKARSAWIDAGRPDKPQLWGQGYFALGDDALAPGADYLREYYAFTGHFAEKVVEGMLTTPQAIAQFVRGYAEAGCDELVLFPTVADLDQLERLADVLASVTETAPVTGMASA